MKKGNTYYLVAIYPLINKNSDINLW